MRVAEGQTPSSRPMDTARDRIGYKCGFHPSMGRLSWKPHDATSPFSQCGGMASIPCMWKQIELLRVGAAGTALQAVAELPITSISLHCSVSRASQFLFANFTPVEISDRPYAMAQVDKTEGLEPSWRNEGVIPDPTFTCAKGGQG